jgi:hypothetical protein
MSIPKTAITCDIINSRKYSNNSRNQLKDILYESFTNSLQQIKNAKADKFSFNITVGDEFQFILDNPVLAYDFLFIFRLHSSIQNITPPPLFRASIGIGDISIDALNTYKMDGKAFHLSRDGINKLKEDKFLNRLTIIRSEKQSTNEDFDLACSFLDFFEKNWTIKQRKAVYHYLVNKNLKNVANELDIAYQNVQKRLIAANWKTFEYGKKYISNKIKYTLI